MYGNYVQGSTDSTNNAYNLLVSGAPSGYTSSGLMIGGDTSTVYGFKIQKDVGNNALFDMRADMSNKMSLRYKDNSSGTITSMLELTNDSSLTGSGYGATVNGRVNASSYYVGKIDTRAPMNMGVYMGTDGNVGYFNINKGTGSGGFSFNTYNPDGSILQRNLNLLASGVVQASYYTSTGNSADSEAVAIAGLDASGNLVRNYTANARFRAAEARMTVVEGELTGDVPSKVNEIVTRLNGLHFFSQNIATIAVFTPSSPYTASPAPAPAPAPVTTTLLYGDYITIELSSTVPITSYTVGTDQSFRIPTKYALLGSSDGQTWTILDQTGSNLSYTSNTRSVSASYKYYRFVIQELADTQYWYLTISYLALFNNGVSLFSAENTVSGNSIITNNSLTATVSLSWMNNPNIDVFATNIASLLYNTSMNNSNAYAGWGVHTNPQVAYLQNIYQSGANSSAPSSTVYLT